MKIVEGTLYLSSGQVIELGKAEVSNDIIINLPNGWAKVLVIENDKCYIDLVLGYDLNGEIPKIVSEVYHIFTDDYIIGYKGAAKDLVKPFIKEPVGVDESWVNFVKTQCE